MANEEKLTEKQKRFCEEYIMEWNGVKAYKTAYKGCKSDAAARTNASRLLTNANIKKYLAELSKDIQKQVGISKLMVAKELKRLAFPNVEKLNGDWTFLRVIEEDYNEVQTEDNEGKKVVNVRQYDKLKALLGLSKLFGWDEPKEEEDDGKFKGNLIVQFGIKEYELLPDNENDIVDFTKDEQ